MVFLTSTTAFYSFRTASEKNAVEQEIFKYIELYKKEALHISDRISTVTDIQGAEILTRSAKFSDNLAKIAHGAKVERCIRPYILRSMLTIKMIDIDTEGIGKIQAFDKQSFLNYHIATVRAHERARSQSDFLGVVFIPAFLGMLASYIAFDLDAQIVILFFAAIMFYIFTYLYYRMMEANLSILVKTAELIEKNKTKQENNRMNHWAG